MLSDSDSSEYSSSDSEYDFVPEGNYYGNASLSDISSSVDSISHNEEETVPSILPAESTRDFVGSSESELSINFVDLISHDDEEIVQSILQEYSVDKITSCVEQCLNDLVDAIHDSIPSTSRKHTRTRTTRREE